MRLWQVAIEREGDFRFKFSRISPLAAVLFGHDGKGSQTFGSQSDALKALGHDAVGSGQQADEQIDGRDGRAVLFVSAAEGFTEQANDVIREELAIEDNEAIGVPFFLEEQLLKLGE